MGDRHSKSIPAEILSQVHELVNHAHTLLLPYVTPLTPDERRVMLKMGEKTLSFVEKAHDFAMQNPGLCPPYLDMAAFDIDFTDAHNLTTLNNITLQLHEFSDDTAMVAGSEAYQASLVFYNSVKVAAMQGVPGAKAVYEELRKRFPRGKYKRSGTETENDA